MPNSPIAPVSYIQPLVTLRRPRRLAAEGEVLVGVGQAVASGDALARSSLGAGHRMLDAARALGLSPEKAQAAIPREVGEQVEEGDIIAGQRRAGARQLRAPAGGVIAAISEGQVLLQVTDERSFLPARVPGMVVNVHPGYGATIEFVGAWVQAVWGNRQLGDGFLHVVGEGPEQLLTADQVDMSLRGAILVAGRCEQPQSLELAAEVPVRGLILGSMATQLGPVAAALPYPLVLTEGFGSAPMNGDAFRLFSNHNGDAATVNAQKIDAVTGDRPEVFIPVKDAGSPPQPLPPQTFRIGHAVRVLTGPQKGGLGEIRNISLSPLPLPSGLRAAAAEIVLEDGSQILAPLVNLEILG
ncbi:MAG: hypothetical protein KIS85_01450 [Anaerolineales bacterium]|nr:hypothetical protein [Anaerolineales bacterium]